MTRPVKLKYNKQWQVSRVMSNSLLTTLALFIVRVANTVCFLIITWYLGEKEAGVYAIALNYALFFAQLAFWGLDQLLVRDISLRKENIGDTIGFFLFIRAIATFVCCALLIIFITSQEYDSGTRNCLLVGSMIVVTESITKFCQTVFSAYEKSKYSVLLSVTNGILKLTGIILIIVAGYLSAFRFVAMIAVTSVISLAVGLFFVFRLFDRPKLRNISYLWNKYYYVSLPFVAISFASTIEFQADTLLLMQLLKTDIEVKIGMYNAITLILYTLLMATQGLRSALLPGISRVFRQNQHALAALFQQLFRLLFLFTIPVALVISWFSPNIVQLIYGSKFSQAAAGIRIIVWSFVFLTSVLPATTILVVLDKRRLLLIIQIFSTLVNITLNIVLIPYIDVQGAVWSRFFSSLMVWSISIIAIWKVINLNINHRIIIKFLLILAMTAGFIQVVYGYFHVYWMITAIAAMALYTCFIFVTGCVNKNDLRFFNVSAK
ncbi:MAG: oligosaccharide flippase family protein [Herpetosiphonaceae bacterium]|nr:oligosaccharide flippase family protein [Herpetosiphonaceae bacterium]